MRSATEHNTDATPFERDHRSYGWMKRVIKHVGDPMDAVVIVEQERPGCTSPIAEDAVLFYRLMDCKEGTPKGLTTNLAASLRTIHYVDIEQDGGPVETAGS